MALSYYPQGTASQPPMDRSAAAGAGLGWPAGPLTARMHGVLLMGAARIGGLGWPGNSGPIESGQNAGQGSRGVQVNEARSEADGGDVRGTFGSGVGTQRPDPGVTEVSRETSVTPGSGRWVPTPDPKVPRTSPPSASDLASFT